ncbi:BAG family molecular chaperone regulator 1-like [Rutidosis leptorrhynchoides]|uniref:BAG family molecular chaperone regulator 1-like n=1 Tax=Rutidosis leptorrhynchoides TaxID=125765 RepID=UPI003A9908D5
MEPMKMEGKKGIFSSMKKKSSVNKGDKDMEIRPGGMLVQKRDSIPNSPPIPIPSIRLRIKYGSSYNEIRISPQASFGELKKMISVHTGLHPEEQKLIYNDKERDSKAFLDVSRVKDGSKIVLVEDIASKERRRLEKIKNAKIEKASKIISGIRLELDKVPPQVAALEKASCEGRKVKEMDVDNLTGTLMTKLVELDSLIVDGDLKSQKRMQERRAQECIESLDKLKIQISKASRNRRKQEIPIRPLPNQKQQQPMHSYNPFVETTKWETFD